MYSRPGIRGSWTSTGRGANDVASRNEDVVYTTRATVDKNGGRNMYQNGKKGGWTLLNKKGFNFRIPGVDVDGSAVGVTTAHGIWKRD